MATDVTLTHQVLSKLGDDFITFFKDHGVALTSDQQSILPRAFEYSANAFTSPQNQPGLF